jgi:hypothetical protein
LEIESLERRLGGDTEPAGCSATAKGLEYATSHAFERKSVVPERHVLALALRHSVGAARVEAVLKHAATIPFTHGERDGQKMVTTREVLDQETVGPTQSKRNSHNPCSDDWNMLHAILLQPIFDKHFHANGRRQIDFRFRF